MSGYSFGECPICGQGLLVAVRNYSTGQLLLMCDDCESQWHSPADAKSFKNAISDEIQTIQNASLDELVEAGWMPPGGDALG